MYEHFVSWAADHFLNLIKENLRRASKESMTRIEPRSDVLMPPVFGKSNIWGINVPQLKPDKYIFIFTV